jgi:hypothetical protein
MAFLVASFSRYDIGMLQCREVRNSIRSTGPASKAIEGRLFMYTQDHLFKGEDVVGFLKQHLAPDPGEWLIIWDEPVSIAAKPSKTFGGSGLRSAFIRNACLPLRPSALRRKGCGSCSKAANEKQSVVQGSRSARSRLAPGSCPAEAPQADPAPLFCSCWLLT